jgi:hypothetical protein
MTASEEIARLEDELIEAKLEIKRHHKDFERIRTVLDEHDATMVMPGVLIKEIRNIVG